MKKENLVLATAFLAIVVLAQAETSKGSAQKGLKKAPGASVEQEGQVIMYQIGNDNRDDTRNSLSEMQKTNRQKAKQRKFLADQKAAQAKAKKALKMKDGKAGGKAPVTIKK